MKDDGVDVNIKEKPHPYGLLMYLAAQRLQHSDASIMVDFEPRLPANRPTARVALMSIATRPVPLIDGHSHFFCDSTLAGMKYLERFHQRVVYLSFSVNESATAGIAELYKYATKGLPVGGSRTYQRGQAIGQFIKRGKYITGVMSNALGVAEEELKRPQPHLSCATAVCMLENDTVEDIINAFQLGEEVPADDIAKVIEAATGQDILMPPPMEGKELRLDEEGMKKMKVPQL